MKERDIPAICHRETNQNLWHDVEKLEVRSDDKNFELSLHSLGAKRS